MAWNARVKVEGLRDGVFSVQVIPGAPNAQVVVQTFAGAVYLFDADNGDLLWKTNVGIPYWSAQPAAYNSQSIYVTRRNILHVLNRSTGVQRVFTYNTATKEMTFGYEMSYAPNAAPVADEITLHVNSSSRMEAFALPDFEDWARVKKALLERKAGAVERALIYTEEELTSPDSKQPIYLWSHQIAPQATDFPPLIYSDRVGFLTTDGELLFVDRYGKGARIERPSFKMNGRITGAAGQYYGTAYVGSDDYNLYAIDLNNARLVWRYVSGAPILQKPEVNDRDVFISPERIGLRLLDRATGREVWTNRDASRFLATNDRFVYGLDRDGMFYVLDGRRGSTLAKYDLSDWTIPVANEWTDRIYLAANDGQIMCLRNKDLTKPLAM